MKIIIRILSSPFIMGLYALIGVHTMLKGTYCYIRYGGEMLTYMKGDEEVMTSILNELREGR